MNYKEVYFYLFNQITDALIKMDGGEIEKAKEILEKAQQECEEKYIGRA